MNAPAPRVRQPGGRGRRQQQVPPLLVHQPGDLSPPAPDPGEDGGRGVPDTGGGREGHKDGGGGGAFDQGGVQDGRRGPVTRSRGRKIVDY